MIQPCSARPQYIASVVQSESQLTVEASEALFVVEASCGVLSSDSNFLACRYCDC